MSEAPAEAEELDEDAGSPIPDPPRRVPFGVAITTALLGFVALFLLLTATLIIVASTNEPDGMGQALAEGLGAAAILVAAALVTALAWSFVRDGRTVGPMIVGCVVLLLGLLALGNGVIGDSPDPGLLRLSMVALALGLGLLLVPLAGHGPAYLAARRVWSRAERDWLHEMATPVVAVPVVYPQHQWPGHYPPPQHWGGYPPQPAYPPQYQYPPQQAQPPAWGGQPPQQPQAWPDPAAPVWVDQQPPAQQFSAPPFPAQQFPAQPAQPFSAQPAQEQPAQPFSAQPAQEQPAQPLSGQPALAQPAPASPPPAASAVSAESPTVSVTAEQQPVAPATAQQAPTEQIRPAEPVPPDAPR